MSEPRLRRTTVPDTKGRHDRDDPTNTKAGRKHRQRDHRAHGAARAAAWAWAKYSCARRLRRGPELRPRGTRVGVTCEGGCQLRQRRFVDRGPGFRRARAQCPVLRYRASGRASGPSLA